ncbi:hypothetical protein PDIDSM_1842 [Penicillium digitatum]|nr:hypothetical protein PDIDSM_1842 [Penicillium digitatum]
MEKLPIHSKEGYGDTLDLNKPHRRVRPGTPTYLCRIGVIALFCIGYILLLRPSSPRCTGIALQMESYRAEVQEEYENYLQLGRVASDTHQTPEQTKIPLEAHIMSKCPDAQDCLQNWFYQPWKESAVSVSKDSEDIECKHGPGECIGDMLMLCAANLPFPPTADEASLPSQYPGPRLSDREFVHHCALEHGIDFDALNKCASQQNDDPNDGNDGGPPLSGIALLRESAMHGEQIGVKISCTVRLDDDVWCIRDSDEWKNCAQNGEGSQPSALVDQVEKLWKERN